MAMRCFRSCECERGGGGDTDDDSSVDCSDDVTRGTPGPGCAAAVSGRAAIGSHARHLRSMGAQGLAVELEMG